CGLPDTRPPGGNFVYSPPCRPWRNAALCRSALHTPLLLCHSSVGAAPRRPDRPRSGVQCVLESSSAFILGPSLPNTRNTLNRRPSSHSSSAMPTFTEQAECQRPTATGIGRAHV